MAAVTWSQTSWKLLYHKLILCYSARKEVKFRFMCRISYKEIVKFSGKNGKLPNTNQKTLRWLVCAISSFVLF